MGRVIRRKRREEATKNYSTQKMSSQKGNSSKQKKPAHQNKFAFKHNKNSKKTQEILNIPTEGLCQHCHDVIEWKKKYRKYKPITSPTKWYFFILIYE